ncbi:SLC13 family permease [Demequina silvatica]|uniref:SLC13 family permease n=1 Tax=Demequina silvatica TaxID=1638988 RepID=UPI0007856302|nr:SLC13 family permease [Demequina silvatica]
MDPILITALILAAAVVAFVTNRVPAGVVAVGVSVALWATGILTLGEAMAGFGDPTVVFIASLFIVSEALDATGVTAWVGQLVATRVGTSRTRVVVAVAGLVALVTALISVNGAVAALIPVVAVVAVRAALPPSQMMMPLAFAAHAGSMLALTGTPVNIIVSEGAVDAGGRAFGFFEFAGVGIPLLVGSVAIIVLLGRRLLPHRAPATLPPDVTAYVRSLRAEYALGTGAELVDSRSGVTEVVVPPRSPLIGTHLFVGQSTPSGDLVVLGLRRAGDDASGPDAVLAAGDSVLVQGPWDSLERHTSGDEVLVVASPEVLRRAVPLGAGAKRALIILGAMVLLLATGAVPPAIAGLLAAGAVIVARVMPVATAYRAISWPTLLIVAGMIPLSAAFTSTGTADLVAETLLDVVGDASPTIALLAMCLITMVLGQLISNTATVLIMVPIASVVAADLGVSVQPFMMALAVTGAAAFLTPVATAANTMVMETGGYKFGDYVRFGAPFATLFLAVAVWWVPLIWQF